jgi:hypothetical protein
VARFLRAGREVMLSAQSGEAKVMPRESLQRTGLVARRTRANKHAADLAPIIAELRAAGITSLTGIAGALNERGIPTTRGSGPWYHAQVGRMLARMPA